MTAVLEKRRAVVSRLPGIGAFVRNDTVATVIAFALLLAVWQLASLALGPDSKVLAGPWTVVATGFAMAGTGELIGHLSGSVWTLLTAAASAVAIGVPLGFAIGLSRIFASGAELTLRFMRNISALALLPLFVVWFGLGATPVYAMTLYLMLTIVIYNSLGAVREVPRKYVAAVRTLGGGWVHQVLGVYLPASLPGIVSGIRLCVIYGWQGVVAAEVVLSASGIGGMMAEGRVAGRVDVILLGMLLIGVVNMVFEWLIFGPVERSVARRWRSA